MASLFLSSAIGIVRQAWGELVLAWIDALQPGDGAGEYDGQAAGG